jgi:hypothetical protein
MIFQIQLPSGITKTLNYASNCATALSMIVIGNILAEVKVNEIVSGKNISFCIVRLLIFPIVVFTFCKLIGIDELVTAVLAGKYNGDDHFAVKVVFLSTILSLLTIPMICILMLCF